MKSLLLLFMLKKKVTSALRSSCISQTSLPYSDSVWILWRGDLAGLHLVDVSGLESESGKDGSISVILTSVCKGSH